MQMQTKLHPSLTSSVGIPIALMPLTDTLVGGLNLEGIFPGARPRNRTHTTQTIAQRKQFQRLGPPQVP